MKATLRAKANSWIYHVRRVDIRRKLMKYFIHNQPDVALYAPYEDYLEKLSLLSYREG